MVPLYKALNLEISYDPVSRIIYCKWIGSQNRDTLMKSGKVILDFVRDMKASKVLNDNRLVEGPWTDSSEWTSEVWFPEMFNAGLKYFAWIFSPDIWAQLSATRALPKQETEIIRFFKSYPEALEWLLASKD